MKRVTGKRVSLLIIMAVMILMVTGCGSESKGDKQTSSGTVQESQSTSGSENQSSGDNEEQESDFDFSQAFDNVEVNGKKVPFPFTLNDLGEDFSVDSIVEMGDGTCGGTLYYKDNVVAEVFLNISNKNEFNNNSKIFRIDFGENYPPIINVKEINCSNNAEDILNNFIGLEKKYDDKNILSFLEKRQGNNTISFFLNEDGTICSVRIKKGE